jgi:hypothetical protein
MHLRNLDTLRNAALQAGVSLERLVRSISVRQVQRPMLAGIGFLAAVTIVALIHFGADVRVGLAGGPSGLLPSLAQPVAGGEEQLPSLHSERDAAA